MDPVVVIIAILAIVGPAVLFLIKLALFTVAAAVVANAVSPTVVIKKADKHDQD